jgi:hypothetical protein
MQLLKQCDGFWVSYHHPESVCFRNENTATTQMSQADAFQTLLKDPGNIIALQ